MRSARWSSDGPGLFELCELCACSESAAAGPEDTDRAPVTGFDDIDEGGVRRETGFWQLMRFLRWVDVVAEVVNLRQLMGGCCFLSMILGIAVAGG